MVVAFTYNALVMIISNKKLVRNLHYVNRSTHKAILVAKYCVISLQVTWMKDNREIHDGDKYTLIYSHGICTMEISKANLDDSGKYTCIAKNPLGEQTTSCKVEVEGEQFYLYH